ncbi:hypothetical protein CC80DRAFT_114514 [Byssothecium circinans]|uniref:Uncharacterized protein n=1 Tax=Byssothecium circinans TaxID=147558 RepID=A0A6A5U0L0_9PLEO|nr:hypothetical protein CC80DRAFT_114514 [Byssothecium circinans]
MASICHLRRLSAHARPTLIKHLRSNQKYPTSPQQYNYLRPCSSNSGCYVSRASISLRLLSLLSTVMLSSIKYTIAVLFLACSSCFTLLHPFIIRHSI